MVVAADKDNKVNNVFGPSITSLSLSGHLSASLG